uniref:Uncharacterized protein n=1 Tax=Rhizophora mucronata TaxID=61149 RepID=A0A2P2N5G6_RHIMU
MDCLSKETFFILKEKKKRLSLRKS